MSNILAFAEARSGDLRKVALEAVTAARSIADSAGGQVHAFLAGAPGVASHAGKLGEHGADVVVVVEHEGFAKHNPEALARTVADRIKAGGYRAALFPASAHGRDIAPRVAALLGVPMASDATSIELQGDTVTARHPVYTGKVIAEMKLAANPAIVTIRPGNFTPAPNAKAGTVESVQPSGDPGASRAVTTDLQSGSSGKLDLGEAPVIVSGGRGLKSAENFKLVEELADAFGNAAVGATRAVTDDGWRPHSDQIGQTGRQVSPDLYVAVGISGAIQHLAGMRTSKTIVAINKDPEAPIFKVADYGIVGDVFDVVPALTAAVREARKQH
jgi:electron transfer flavoprotein alpha subunit